MRGKVYVYVTDDEYELPIYVCDTVKELSELTGYTESSIYSNITRWEKGEREYVRFRRIYIGKVD